jgi:plasmid stabilization system protein ParE
MITVEWTGEALSDLTRLHGFLAPLNPRAAAQIVRSLAAVPSRRLEYPRIGEKLEEFAPREVRRMLVGNYEMRYEIRGSTIYIVRLWHTREER